MKSRSFGLWALGLTALGLAAIAQSRQSPPATSSASSTLSTGKRITIPPLGDTQNAGSEVQNLILSPNGKFAISSDMGFHHQLWSISTANGKPASHLEFPGGSGIPAAGNTGPSSNGLYYGLAVADNGDGTSAIFAAQGARDAIAVVTLDNGTGILTSSRTISTKKADFPAGLALDHRGLLYVANNDPTTFAQPTSIAIYQAATGAEVGRYTFSGSFGGTPNFPYAIATLADGSKTFVASQRDPAVYVLDTSNPAAPTPVAALPTGAHPVSLLLNRNQTRLYVANAHSDTVSVINTATNAIVGTTLLRPAGARDIAGATPTGLALSTDESTLYVSLGDMNAVAVVKTSDGTLDGYIPAGWYPSAVVFAPTQKLLVASAKGVQPLHPNPGYTLSAFNGDPQYDHNLIEGTVQTIQKPSPESLKLLTAQVLANNKITAHTSNPPNPLAGIGLSAGKIKHIIYIVKENRTYDQVLGDIPTGNGDPALAIFGASVTPNQHALAQRFVLLDNFYDCGEASGDGWPWSTQGIANEYVIKNLPYNYSGRGRNYDFEGQNNGYLSGGFPATDPDGVTLSSAFPSGMPAIPDVAEAPAGHIWDGVRQAGLAYRNYGFFYSFGVTAGGQTILPDNYPAASGLLPPGHDLAGFSDFDFRRYDNDYPDSDAPGTYFSQTGDANSLYASTKYGKYNMPSRYSEWKREFDEMIAADPSGNSVPALMTVRFNHDHTQGFSPGKHSPRSEVADNDYAVGQLVDAVSKSAIWKSTAIFVLEDDAQDGPDHVDSHRSTCLVISPWIKKAAVDHTFYNTDSVLKTIEQLLGLPFMSQYDAVANTILAWDALPLNDSSFTAVLPAKEIIAEKNPALASLKPSSAAYRYAKLSQSMDFTHPDSAPALALNEIVWKSVRGFDSAMPASRNARVSASTSKSSTARTSSRDKDD